MNEVDIKKLLKKISKASGSCNIQHNGCPCGTCFQNMKGIDYVWLSWLLLLALRGDYNYEELRSSLTKCVKGGQLK